MGLRIAEMLLSDRLALVLVAGCMLSLACLVSPGRNGVHLEGVEGVPGRRARAACQGGVPGLRAHAEENKRWKRSDQHTPTADDC